MYEFEFNTKRDKNGNLDLKDILEYCGSGDNPGTISLYEVKDAFEYAIEISNIDNAEFKRIPATPNILAILTILNEIKNINLCNIFIIYHIKNKFIPFLIATKQNKENVSKYLQDGIFDESWEPYTEDLIGEKYIIKKFNS